MTRDLETRNNLTAHANTPELTLALIPAHNEERFIGSMVLAVRAYVDEVIVVDDGSSDRTSEIARQAGATVFSIVAMVVRQRQSILASCMLVPSIQLHLVMLDGDGQHSADDIPQVLEPNHSRRADVVVGSRFLQVKSDIPAYRQVGQHGLTLVTNLASGVRVSDSQSGFRAFSGRAVQHLTFTQGGFSIESEMQFLVKEHHLRVVEAPIKVIYAEKAKRNPVRHGLQVLNGVLRLMGQLRPLLFFGASGFMVFLDRRLTWHVPDPDLRGDTGISDWLRSADDSLCVVGMVLCFAGVILHSTRVMIRDVRYGILHRQSTEPAAAADVLRPQWPTLRHAWKVLLPWLNSAVGA